MVEIMPANEERALAPAGPAPADARELAAMDTARLREELAAALRLTVAAIVRLAFIVRLLEERGEDLSGLKLGLLNHVRRVAYGQVLPEIVVRFAGQPLVLQRVSALPRPDQERLARSGDDGMVELVVRREQGFDKRMADPARLTREQVWQVFATDHIRSEAEQILLLEEQNRHDRGEMVKAPPLRGKVRADRERKGLMVGRTFVPQTEIAQALADLRSDAPEVGPPSGEGVTVPVRLTDDEHRRLKVTAAETGRPMTEIVREALRAAGLI